MNFTHQYSSAILGILLLFCLNACKKESQNSIDQGLITDYLSNNNLTPTDTTDAGAYVVVEDIGAGSLYPQSYGTVLVDYEGSLLDGHVFDSSYERGEAAQFILCDVLAGFSEGVQTVTKGGKAKIILPSALGYGNIQIGSIPANSVLIFDIHLLELENESIQNYIDSKGFQMSQTDGGTYYEIITPGTGSKPVESNTQISVNYTLELLDGTPIESNIDPENPTILTLSQTIPGWQQTIPQITEGGEIRIIVPAKHAYGDIAIGDIPAYAPLFFTIQLLDL